MSHAWSSKRSRVRIWAALLLVGGGLAPPAFGQAVRTAARAAEAPAPVVAGAYAYEALSPADYAPPALARIPGGSFLMGNSYSNLFPNEGWAHELPVHAVPVGEFFVGRFEFTNEELARTLQWAYVNGLVELDQTATTNVVEGATNVVTNLYGTVRNTEGTKRELVDLDATYCQIAFTNGAFAVAAGKTNFPAIHVTWHGALAVCNYLSDREGLARAVDFAPADWTVDVAAEGYRLPTEAEWEKAARGGNPGTHYPWPDDSVQGTNVYLYSTDPVKANYWDARYGAALTNHPMHPWFGEAIRTTPVGYYDGAQAVTNLHANFVLQAGTAGADFGQTNDMANGYGLYDVAGNVYEWCWDYHATNWYADPAASLPDPTGPPAAASFYTQRVARGGGFTYYIGAGIPDPSFQRCAFHTSLPAPFSATYLGFRVARRKLVVNAVAHAANVTTLSYWGASGKVYSVVGATDLAATNEWPVMVETTNAVTGAAEIAVEDAGTRRYYRIRVREAP
jgi:formylglycine-generating enzyme required for sulfatase activity